MKKVQKTLTLIVITACSVFNVSAEISSDSAEPSKFIILHKEDDEQGDKHHPHRTPAANIVLPVVYFNADNNLMTFSSSSATSFTYYIYDPADNIINSGHVQLEQNHLSETICVSHTIDGEYTIIVEINGQQYIGIY